MAKTLGKFRTKMHGIRDMCLPADGDSEEVQHALDDDERIVVNLFDAMCKKHLKRLCELLEKDINVNSVFKVRTVRHGSVYFYDPRLNAEGSQHCWDSFSGV